MGITLLVCEMSAIVQKFGQTLALPFFGIGMKTDLFQSMATAEFSKFATHRHHQMVDTKIRLIIFFAAKDGEALQSQQKQDQELTVAQIMNSLLSKSDLNCRK